MAYLNPASNPKNCESFTADNLQTFRTIFVTFWNLLTEKYLHEKTHFVSFWNAICLKKNHSTFQKNKDKRKSSVLISLWYLVISLVPFF